MPSSSSLLLTSLPTFLPSHFLLPFSPSPPSPSSSSCRERQTGARAHITEAIAKFSPFIALPSCSPMYVGKGGCASAATSWLWLELEESKCTEWKVPSLLPLLLVTVNYQHHHHNHPLAQIHHDCQLPNQFVVFMNLTPGQPLCSFF